jgi:Fic family protein
MPTLYDHPTDMEPLLPADRDGSLAALGWQIVRRAERLGSALHPVTSMGLAEVVRVMNSYYSHLIEGHHTTPADLDAVLRGKLNGAPQHRQLQQLHLAHLGTQAKMEELLRSAPACEIAHSEFIADLHACFYTMLPPADRCVAGIDGNAHAIEPGHWRRFNVSVGQHLAPKHEALGTFLQRFTAFYSPLVRDTGDSLVACAAAHHRLAWIHPFADGNGRVTRLFSHAWLWKAGVHAHGLWSISRGLARQLDGYRSKLAEADQKRRNDIDGRGYLSEASLAEFCRFFLETCMDQLDYMSGCLAVDTLVQRITGHAELRTATGDLPKGASLLLREVCLRGEIPRGDAARVIGKSARTAQPVVRKLLDGGYLKSPSEKGALRLGFPQEALSAWLPGLFLG